MIDTHAHLDDRKFDSDREKVIQNSFANGIEKIVNIGTDLKTSRLSVALAQKYPQIFASIAVHPHASKYFALSTVSELEKLSADPKVLAIGEIGLDFYRNWSPKEDQIKAFKSQIELAFKLKKPIVYHIRDAFEETWAIILETKAYQLGGILHSFSGNVEQAKKATELGLYLSFNGTLTYKNSLAQEVVKNIPLDLILLETDCPYLPPQPYRGQRNQPDYVKYVLEKMSELLNKPFEELEKITTENAQRIFKFPQN